jgi:nitroreductase
VAPADVLEPLLSRRSVGRFATDGPSDAELDAILQAAVTVPDHGRLRPWRLVVVRDDARAAFGDALADAGRAANPDLPAPVAEKLRGKAFVAPALVAVVARVDATAKVPAWEQIASASCAGYAITLAAHQLGLGAMWKSSPFSDGPMLRDVLDMTADDQFLGWVNLGRLPEPAPTGPRPAVDLTDIVRVLDLAGRPHPYRGA